MLTCEPIGTIHSPHLRAGCVRYIEDVDVLDGTPLLDIKPYVARFDSRPDARGGWHAEIDDATAERCGRRTTGET